MFFFFKSVRIAINRNSFRSQLARVNKIIHGIQDLENPGNVRTAMNENRWSKYIFTIIRKVLLSNVLDSGFCIMFMFKQRLMFKCERKRGNQQSKIQNYVLIIYAYKYN